MLGMSVYISVSINRVNDRHENAVQLTSVTLNYNRLWHLSQWQGVNCATLLSTKFWNNPQTPSDVEWRLRCRKILKKTPWQKGRSPRFILDVIENLGLLFFCKALTVPRCSAQRFGIVLKLQTMSSDGFGAENFFSRHHGKMKMFVYTLIYIVHKNIDKSSDGFGAENFFSMHHSKIKMFVYTLIYIIYGY